MDTPELQALAKHARFMKEAGIALLLSCVVLAAFLFIPLTSRSEDTNDVLITKPVAINAYADIPLQAEAAIVYDLVSEETLFDKNADAQLPLASLTKLLTVYAALAEIAPGTPITISKSASASEYPRLFASGETLSLADLSRLTLTGSLNDGAAAIAETIAARKQISMHAMLASAATALGLSQTYAVNGSGLDESLTVSGAYGSAHDVALLAGALVKRAPTIASATTESSATAANESGKTYTVNNTNPTVIYTARLLLSKTGFTDLAGGNLVLVFDAGIDHPVAVVVLGSTEKDRFTDATALVAATLAHFSGVSSL